MPSFVTNLPNGPETGVFLAVDLGGTNCRISAVELHGNSTYTMKQSKYAVPREFMVNPRHEPLFDFVATNIASFLKGNPEMAAQRDPKSTRPSWPGVHKLGFTFSFTYESHSVCHGTMLQWDKGWDIPDAIGRDPCRMLQDALDRQTLPVRVVALTNDSVGTFMATAYTSSEACSPLLGAIFGTGTNAAYVEHVARIDKLPQKYETLRGKDAVMVINTEWGAWFDKTAAALPSCMYDDILDLESAAPGEQRFEKQTSGLYLGELMRLAMLDLIAAKQLQMTARSDSPLHTPYRIDAAFVSMLAAHFESQKKIHWERTMTHISERLNVDDVTLEDIQALELLAAAIMKRAAQLAGAAMAAIIIQSGRLPYSTLKPAASRKWVAWYRWLASGSAFCSLGRGRADDDADSDRTMTAPAGCIEIGIDGSLFEHYPPFEKEIRKVLRAVPRIGPQGEARVKIRLVKDGSSLGAALIAQSVS